MQIHTKRKGKNVVLFALIKGENIATRTLSSKSFPLGSMADSSLKASSPTKQISWPSWNENHPVNIFNKKAKLQLRLNTGDPHTGSAKITTSTVAFPGVSRLTNGVRIFWFSFFIKASSSGSWEMWQNINKNWKMDYIIGKKIYPQSSFILALEDMKMLFSQRLLHDQLLPRHHEARVYTEKTKNPKQIWDKKHLEAV